MAIYPRDSLQRSDLDLFAKKVGIVVLYAIALALLWAARDVLIIIFIAAVLAAGISPAVHRVRVWGRYRLHRNIARGSAVLIVYLPFLVLAIMRNEMIGAVVRRAMEHPEFRRRLMENPEEALAAHGFALEQPDLAAIEKIRAQLREGGDSERKLVTIAEHYGLEP